MPDVSNIQWPPPSEWQDFETLCHILWKTIWNDPQTQKNGRPGQGQNGVDIYGQPDQGSQWAGVQCKLKSQLAGHTLSAAEVEAEIHKAEAFTPPLSQYIIATTASRNANIQRVVRQLNADRQARGAFSVTVQFWEDIHQLIFVEYPHIGRQYIQNFIYPGSSFGTHPPKTLSQEVEQVIQLYLTRSFRNDDHTQLEAGESDSAGPKLTDIFIDVKAQYSVEVPGSIETQKTSGSAISTLLDERQPRHILVVGGPGQGKSTLTQQLAQYHRGLLLAASNPALLGNYAPDVPSTPPFQVPSAVAVRLPFRIILKDFARWLSQKYNPAESSLLHYLAERISESSPTRPLDVVQVGQILELRQCLVIFDGLDEVADNRLQARLHLAITDFLEQAVSFDYSVRVVITSRPLNEGLSEFVKKGQFWLVTLLNLEQTQATQYAIRWAQAYLTSADRRQQLLEQFNTSLANPKIKALLTTPLQVRIILEIIGEGNTPPSQREALFREYWDAVYKREKHKHSEPNPLLHTPKATLFKLHAYLGYILHQRSAGSAGVEARLSESEFRQSVRAFLTAQDEDSAPPGEIERKINLLIKETGDRIFLITKPVDGFFGFELRSFQEFFAAAYLTQKERSPDRLRDLLMTFAPYPHWRNVLLFAAGRVANDSSEPDYCREIFLEGCKELDRTQKRGRRQKQHTGCWLALEIAADGAFGEMRRLQRDLIEYGLGVLDTILTPQEVTNLTHFTDQFRLSFQNRSEVVIPFVVKKFEAPLSLPLVYQLLNIYLKEMVRNADLSDRLLYSKVERLLETPQVAYATPMLLHNALEYGFSPKWVARQLRRYWPGWADRLFNWWEYTLDENISNDTYLFYKRWDVDGQATMLSYYRKVFRKWKPSYNELNWLSQFLVKSDSGNHPDSWEDYRILPLKKRARLSLDQAQPQEVSLTVVDYIMALLKCRHIIAAKIEDKATGFEVYPIEVGNSGTIDLAEGFFGRVEISSYIKKQMTRFLLRRSSLPAQVQLPPVLLGLLWVIYYSATAPDESNLDIFLADLPSIFAELARYPTTQPQEDYIQLLSKILIDWPFLSLAALYAVKNPASLLTLRPYLTAPAQKQLRTEVIDILEQHFPASTNENEAENDLPQEKSTTQDKAEQHRFLKALFEGESVPLGQILPDLKKVADRLEVETYDLIKHLGNTDFSIHESFEVEQFYALAQSVEETLGASANTNSNRQLLQTKLKDLLWLVRHNSSFYRVDEFRLTATRLIKLMVQHLYGSDRVPSSNLAELSLNPELDLPQIEQCLALSFTLFYILTLRSEQSKPAKELPELDIEILTRLVMVVGLLGDNYWQGAEAGKFFEEFFPPVTSLDLLDALFELENNPVAELGLIQIWALAASNKYNNEYNATRPRISLPFDRLFELVSTKLLPSSRPGWRVAGIAMLNYSQLDRKHPGYQELLRSKLRELPGCEVEERRAWLRHLSKLEVAPQHSKTWAAFLESIISNADLYPYDVLQVVTEQLASLQPAQQGTISTERARELGLPT